METRGQRAIRIHEQGRPEERIRERGQLGIRIRERERQASLVAFGCETGFIGSPGQSEFLAFGGDPVRRSLVGVAIDFFSLFVVMFLLSLRLIASGAVGSSVATLIIFPI